MSKKRKKKRQPPPLKTSTGRQRKRQERQAQRKRQGQLRLAGWGIAGLIVVGIIIFAVSQSGIGDRPAAHPDEQNILVEGRQHLPDGTPLNFVHSPPSSGNHYGSPLPYGFYEETVPEGNWVHSLEHGGVNILYNCPDGCPDLLDQLRDFYNDAPATRCGETRLIVLPYSRGMETQLSILGWGQQLDLEEFDAELLTNFFLRYEDRGPETIPCGA